MKVNGSLGTSNNSAVTVCDCTASDTTEGSANDVGTGSVLAPPVMYNSAVVPIVPVGTTTCSQWCQVVRLTSAEVRQVWLVMSSI